MRKAGWMAPRCRTLALWFVPIRRCRGKKSIVMKTPLSRRSCLIVKCTSLLHSICPWRQTVTAALTPSSFVGPRHPGKESKGNHVLLPPHSVPAGASLQGAHVADFFLNMLCLEHRLTSEPASFTLPPSKSGVVPHWRCSGGPGGLPGPSWENSGPSYSQATHISVQTRKQALPGTNSPDGMWESPDYPGGFSWSEHPDSSQ